MPVSKKRKKKRQKRTPPPQKSGVAPKPKLTKQRILLYVISAVMILSLAASFVIGSTGSVATPPNNADIQTTDGNNLLTDPPISTDESSSESSSDEATADEATSDEDTSADTTGDDEAESEDQSEGEDDTPAPEEAGEDTEIDN